MWGLTDSKNSWDQAAGDAAGVSEYSSSQLGDLSGWMSRKADSWILISLRQVTP
jgi:hypothetical protein